MQVICTRLCSDHLSVCVGDGSRSSEMIVKISNCAFQYDYYYHYYYYHHYYYYYHYSGRRPHNMLKCQGWICSNKCLHCHTVVQVADQTFYLIQSQYTDTGPTSPSADTITPSVWQDSHRVTNFPVTGMTRPGKRSRVKAGLETRSAAQKVDNLTTRPTRQSTLAHCTGPLLHCLVATWADTLETFCGTVSREQFKEGDEEADRGNDGKTKSERGLALNGISYYGKLRTARSGVCLFVGWLLNVPATG